MVSVDAIAESFDFTHVLRMLSIDNPYLPNADNYKEQSYCHY